MNFSGARKKNVSLFVVEENFILSLRKYPDVWKNPKNSSDLFYQV